MARCTAPSWGRLLTCLLLLLMLLASAAASASDFYERLGVERDATDKEIGRAYRKLALKWHPDKNPEAGQEEAERIFIEIAEAYETLSEPAKRKQYDAGGMDESSYKRGGSPFDFDMASELFRESFGQQLWRSWKPGMTVSGTIVRDGESFTIEIQPDGSSTEASVDKPGRKSAKGSYTYVKSTGGGGGTSYQIQMDGGALGDMLADAMLPSWLVTAVPALVVVVSWVPTLLLGWCCMRCCFGIGR